MTSEGTLDDRYFEWLYSQIGSLRNRNPARSHWKLARELYITPFEWYIPNDDNRAADGCDLRNEFIEEQGVHAEPTWMRLECSMLEMLIALSRRVSFESVGAPDEWFWHLMNNIGLKEYTDANYNKVVERQVIRALERVNKREYTPLGIGGLFPLHNRGRNQQNTELWYQMSAYLLEGNLC